MNDRLFWSKVNKHGPKLPGMRSRCWPWKQSTNNHGYGQYWQGGKLTLAHRVAWQLTSGPIPAGLMVCHRCDNRACCNPAHLFVGTDQDNVQDMLAKGGAVGAPVFGEANGAAKLTDDQVQDIRHRLQLRQSQASIARLYGVDQTTVSRINLGRCWK